MVDPDGLKSLIGFFVHGDIEAQKDVTSTFTNLENREAQSLKHMSHFMLCKR